jgi:GH25 family lysozyme M1 (1,4-beta-N-acetylmuramidase)
MLPGIDIAEYQGDIEFPKAKAAGVKWVYARAAAGDKPDAKIKQNARRLHRNDLPFGVYIFWKPEVPAARQLKLVLDAHTHLGASLVPQIDVEHHGDVAPRLIRKRLRGFVEAVEDAIGQPPTIYTGAWFWNRYVRETKLDRCPLWVAQYVHSSPEAYKRSKLPKHADGWGEYAFSQIEYPMPVIGWHDYWSVWQFSAAHNRFGKRLGMRSLDVDLNVMQKADWRRFSLVR